MFWVFTTLVLRSYGDSFVFLELELGLLTLIIMRWLAGYLLASHTTHLHSSLCIQIATMGIIRHACLLYGLRPVWFLGTWKWGCLLLQLLLPLPAARQVFFSFFSFLFLLIPTVFLGAFLPCSGSFEGVLICVRRRPFSLS